MGLLLSGGVLLACHRETESGDGSKYATECDGQSESDTGTEGEAELDDLPPDDFGDPGESDSDDTGATEETGADVCEDDQCAEPGAVLWREVYDIAATFRGLAVADNGDIGILVAGVDGVDDGTTLLVFDSDRELRWLAETPSSASALAGGPSGEFVVVANDDAGALITQFEADGAEAWTVPIAGARLLDVVFDDDGVTSVGAHDGVGAIFRHGPKGELHRTSVMGSLEVRALAMPSDGSVWVLTDTPRLEQYDPSGVLVWSSAVDLLHTATDLAVDEFGLGVVVGARDEDDDAFALLAFNADGAALWSRIHDDLGQREAANAIAVLPAGPFVVAGHTNQPHFAPSTDGLLSVYGHDGIWRGDFVYDGDGYADHDVLEAIAVAPDGAVITAGRHCEAAECSLWVMKVAM